jgi:hypothetical protein
MPGEGGPPARQWIKAALAVLLPLVVLGALVAGAAWWTYLRPLPSDASLAARFRAHRSGFRALAAAIDADATVPSGYRERSRDDPAAVNGSPPRDSRLSRNEVRSSDRSPYQALLRGAGLPGFWRASDGTVWIRIASSLETRKGFVYMARTPSPIYPSLDSLGPVVGRGITPVFRSLGDHWYLYLEARE